MPRNPGLIDSLGPDTLEPPSESFESEVLATYGTHPLEDFRVHMDQLLRNPEGTWRCCDMVLAAFMMDPAVTFTEDGVMDWWRHWCDDDEERTKLALHFDQFVRKGWVKSPKLQEWGYAEESVGAVPYSGLVVVSNVVREALRDAAAEQLWQEKYGEALGRMKEKEPADWETCLQEVEAVLQNETIGAEKMSTRVMSNILKPVE